MNKNLEKFHKTYKRASVSYVILLFTYTILFLYYLYVNDIFYFPDVMIYLFLFTVISAILLFSRAALFSRIAYAPIKKAYENAELLEAYEISKALCEKECYYCNTYIIINHITILNAMGRYQELEAFYAEYKKKILKYVPMALMEREFLILSANLKQEHIIYEKYYERFMNRTSHMRKNSRIKNQFLGFKLQHALLHENYTQVEQLLREYKPGNRQEQLIKAYYTCKGLLGQDRQDNAMESMGFVLTYSEDYAMVREIKALFEHKEHAVYLNSTFFYAWIADALQKNQKRKRIKRVIRVLIVLLFFIALSASAILTLFAHPYVNMKEAVQQVSERSATDVFLQFDFDDVHVGLVKTVGQHKEAESVVETMALGTPIYYVTSIHVSHGKIQSLNMQDGKISYKDFTMKAYAIKQTDAVYVLLRGKLKNVTYEGTAVERIQSASIYGINKKDAYMLNAFIIHDKDFSEEKLHYEIED